MLELGYNMNVSDESRSLRPDRYRPECDDRPKPCPTSAQTHVHEIQGSVMMAEEGDERHNHRFATVTTEVIPFHHDKHRHNHKHAFMVNTDFFDHHHEVAGESGPAIDVGHGKHVHFGMGKSTCNDGHFHDFQSASLIESPLLSNHK